jgi:hypothetical protein
MKKQPNTFENITVEIVHEQSPENPRINDNQTQFAMFHRKYTLPNEINIPNYSEFFNSWEEMEADLQSNFKHVVPVYMLDHSGLAFSLSDFNDRWDSGQVGFIVAKEGTEEEFMKNAQSELLTYGYYISGDCYGFVVSDSESEDMESIWGFYGWDHKESGLLESLFHSLQYSFGLTPEISAKIIEEII